MRLTLRTLLAYLDEILDPQDAAQLKNKIDESEFAAALVHRIRSSVRRLRLDAPALDAQGVGGDLNSVAEYLDNTLPAAQVPNFEKVCLESDVHLGEVASCHQVLTLVLGEPAAVSDKTRQRVYQIASSGASFAEGSSPAVGPPPPGVLRKPQASRLSQVPGAPHIPAAGAPDAVPASTKEAWRAEERRSQQERVDLAEAPRRSRKPSIVRSIAITAVIAFLITAALILAVGPLDQSHPLAKWIRGDSDQFASSVTEPDPLDSQSIAEATDLGESSPRVASSTLMTNEPSSNGGISPPEPIPPLAPPANNGAAADASMLPPPQLNPPANDDLFQPSVVSDFPHAEAPSRDASAPPEPVALDEPGRLDQPATAVPHNEAEAFGQVPPDTVNIQPIFPPQVDTISPPDLGVPVEVTTEPPVTSSAGAVGNVVDDPPVFDHDDRMLLDDKNGVAADFAPKIGTDSLDLEKPTIADIAPPELDPGNAVGDDANAGVEAVEPAAPLEPGRLVTKREVLLRLEETNGSWRRADSDALLNAGDQLLSLPTFRPQVLLPSVHCTLIDGTKARLGQQPLLALEYGQVLLSPTPGTRDVDIGLAGQPVTLEFADDSSAAAVRVRRRHVPGSDPEREAAHTIVEIHAAIGSVHVDVGGQQFTLDPTRKVILVDQYSPHVVNVGKLPRWIEGKDIPRVDQDASKRLQPFLVGDRPVTLSLQERAEDRRYDVRALAVRCLGQLDHFDTLVAALNDPSQRAYWSYQIDSLHEALARDAETAARVRIALEKVHGPEAQRLYEMLWGYSSEQLAAGSAETLVENLIHNSLDYRVLAFENLKRITDATLTYRPWLAAPRRRQGVARWRDRLRKGLVSYKEPPEIVALLNEFAEAR